MSRELILALAGKLSSFALTKLDRSRLYGRKRRILVDPTGNECERAQLTIDGALILRSGMLGSAYFTEDDKVVSYAELVGIEVDGTQAEKQPSTLGVPQTVTGPVMPDEVLNQKLMGVYQVTPIELDSDLEQNLNAGVIYRFPFNYASDFRTEAGFILKNDDGFFVLIGVSAERTWIEPGSRPTELFEQSERDTDDELDFGMF